MTRDTLELIFDVFSLPTTQHRAGLAGLLVHVESMRRRKLKNLPEFTLKQGEVRMKLTKASLQALFDDLYDASKEEIQSKTKWKDKNKKEIRPVRTEKRTETDKTGKSKEVVYYIYRGAVPKAAFLKTFNIPDPWLKLWRDALWATLRGKPTTRGPYERRASKKQVGETSQMWKELLGLSKARSKGQLYTAEVASSLFIGAQAKNAERVPFKGPPDLNFLLHFWPVVMSVYVPETIDREGKRVSTGYVLAIPDVADVQGFSQLYPRYISIELRSAVAGFRPRDSLISLPQEGGLEYAHHLLSLVKAKEMGKEAADYLAAVEVYHLEKRGNNIHMHTADRVPVKKGVLDGYEAIRSSHRNPIFKAQLIRNLLHGARIGERIPWYAGFDRIFATHNWELFVGAKAREFSYAVHERFKSEFQTLRGGLS